jgi:cysteinyl-tRNA synthetase
MSKSLGNVLAVGELLDRVSSGALRIFLLGTQYRAPLDFSEEAMTRAGSAEDRLRNALAELGRLRETLRPSEDVSRGGPPALLRQIAEAEEEFTSAMDDDFNTPRALAALFNLTRDINVSLTVLKETPDKAFLDALGLAGETLRRLGSVLGGLLEDVGDARSYVEMASGLRIRERDYVAAREAVERAVASGRPLPREAVNLIVEFRLQRRDEKDWAAADAIRGWLSDIGVVVDDTAKGARWRVRTSVT